MRGSCHVDQSLKSISSSGHQGLPSAATHWSPAILGHLLTHCHLPVPRRFLEASAFCPEFAGAGPCLSPALFKSHVVNTETSTVPTAGTKQTKQTGFWPRGAYVPVGKGSIAHKSMQIAILTTLLCARDREGRTTELANASVATQQITLKYSGLNSNDLLLSFMVSLDQKCRKKGPSGGGLSL